MREILFRGKRIDNGEWIYGSLVVAGDYCCILPADENSVHPTDYPYLDSETGTIDGHLIPVDPSTVGQYTGLTDKKGKKIFGGDIYTWRDDYNDYHACLICFGEYFDRYANKYATMANGFYIKTLQGETFNFAGNGYSEIETSGNIHDNPELLEDKP